jgi:hypothetical protein
MDLSTLPAASSKNLHVVLVVAFEEVAVSSVALPGSPSCKDHLSQDRGRMRIQFRKAIVETEMPSVSTVLIGEAGQSLTRVLCPVYFILSYKSQIP